MLRLTNLRKVYPSSGSEATVAVDGLSLEIHRGEVFGLLGPNGAGKSTTIGMATGLIEPDQGTVDVDGAGSPTLPKVRAQLGVAPQSLALYDELSGEENLRFFGQLYGLRGTRLSQRVRTVLEQVGLSQRSRDRTGTYSGGMKRRLNFAAAMVHEPPLLLLDEPTAGVDPQSRSRILELVRELARSGRTIVYTTHYMEEAAKICDRVGIVDHGKMLALGTIDELISRHGSDSVVVIRRGSGDEVRIATPDPMRELTLAFASAKSGGDGDAVVEARVERPDLESVFLSLTGRSLRD